MTASSAAASVRGARAASVIGLALAELQVVTEANAPGHLRKRRALDEQGAGAGHVALVVAGASRVQLVRHNPPEERIAQELEAVVGCQRIRVRLVEVGTVDERLVQERAVLEAHPQHALELRQAGLARLPRSCTLPYAGDKSHGLIVRRALHDMAGGRLVLSKCPPSP